jgi:hypothetical protein
MCEICVCCEGEYQHSCLQALYFIFIPQIQTITKTSVYITCQKIQYKHKGKKCKNTIKNKNTRDQ